MLSEQKLKLERVLFQGENKEPHIIHVVLSHLPTLTKVSVFKHLVRADCSVIVRKGQVVQISKLYNHPDSANLVPTN